MTHNQSRLKLGSSNGKYSTQSKDRKRILRAKTDNQRAYMEAIESCDIVFALGPAGSGKTHVAAGMAARYLLDGDVARIVGVRPALETGRSVGFLPGDLDDKIHPYLRPLLEELTEFFGAEEMRKMRAGDAPFVEMAALSYLRGRNFRDAFVVLDEAQNVTFAEMWMFITRLSHGSKMVINGDVTQSDLAPEQRGALAYFSGLYEGIDEVGVVRMSADDTAVRHPLLRKLMEIKNNDDKRNSRSG